MRILADYEPPLRPKVGPTKTYAQPRVLFPWDRDPIGRTAKVLALIIARLHRSDAEMADGRVPPEGMIWGDFTFVLPDFPMYYDLKRAEILARRGGDPVDLPPLTGEIVRNRVLHMYRLPGRAGRPARYGYSSEHPQHRPPGDRLRRTYDVAVNPLQEALRTARPMSLEQAWDLGMEGQR